MNKFKIKFPTKRFAKILLIFACSFGTVAGGYSNVSASGKPPTATATSKSFETQVLR